MTFRCHPVKSVQLSCKFKALKLKFISVCCRTPTISNKRISRSRILQNDFIFFGFWLWNQYNDKLETRSTGWLIVIIFSAHRLNNNTNESKKNEVEISTIRARSFLLVVLFYDRDETYQNINKLFIFLLLFFVLDRIRGARREKNL